MVKSSIALEALKKKKEQITLRMQAIKAREATKNRKNETRKKILIGAFFLDKYEKNNSLSLLTKEIDSFLFRANDRAIFGLEPKKDSKNR